MEREKGLSMVEVMIGFMLMSLLGVGLTRMMSSQFRSARQLTAVVDINQISQKIRESALSHNAVKASVFAFPSNAAAWSECATGRCTPTFRNIALRSRDNAADFVAGDSMANAVFYSFTGQKCTGGGCASASYPLAAIARIHLMPAGYNVYFCIALRNNREAVMAAKQRGVTVLESAADSPSCGAVLGTAALAATPFVRPVALEWSPAPSAPTPYDGGGGATCADDEFLKGNPDGTTRCVRHVLDCQTVRYPRTTSRIPAQAPFRDSMSYWGWQISSPGYWATTFGSYGSYAKPFVNRDGPGRADDIWGVQCINRYQMTGCNYNGNGVSEDSWLADNTCMARRRFVGPELEVINATCCRVIEVETTSTPPDSAFSGIAPSSSGY